MGWAQPPPGGKMSARTHARSMHGVQLVWLGRKVGGAQGKEGTARHAADPRVKEISEMCVASFVLRGSLVKGSNTLHELPAWTVSLSDA